MATHRKQSVKVQGRINAKEGRKGARAKVAALTRSCMCFVPSDFHEKTNNKHGHAELMRKAFFLRQKKVAEGSSKRARKQGQS